MSTRVRSYSKINLGLAIGPVREDGFHGLTTLYQTLDLHDLVTVEARRAEKTALQITSNDKRVPNDERNTAWKMIERALGRMKITAEVAIHIEKRLPVQGGMGAGSANAAAALIALERELDQALPGPDRLRLAAEVGSDVPLFLLGGSVLGLGRGEQVYPLPDLPALACVVAVPEVGVSTPQAFRDWDLLELTQASEADRLEKLSLAYASLYAEPGTSGIIRGSRPGNKQGGSEQLRNGQENDLAENTLLSLVRTGVENDFERVVFPVDPSLREIKRELMGTGSEAALYAALSGSGSALFGLYRSEKDAQAAQQRVQHAGVKALMTTTLPRSEYWTRMFAGVTRPK
ncbi:MAG TPA: 4-(cytidine 5'-diphospho)-2-C-methyl-D-erythritol kinase [Edaphobacter sp.]|nr:4-(cytidine 5'-diphospho)-2-C-methyl-D-erythritol kinase [Edaphobacter sp.]